MKSCRRSDERGIDCFAKWRGKTKGVLYKTNLINAIREKRVKWKNIKSFNVIRRDIICFKNMIQHLNFLNKLIVNRPKSKLMKFVNWGTEALWDGKRERMPTQA